MHDVQVLRVMGRRRRYRPDGSTMDKAHVSAYVDGYRVTRTEGRAWRCDCPNVRCPHPAALADVLHPSVLAMLDGGDQ